MVKRRKRRGGCEGNGDDGDIVRVKLLATIFWFPCVNTVLLRAGSEYILGSRGFSGK